MTTAINGTTQQFGMINTFNQFALGLIQKGVFTKINCLYGLFTNLSATNIVVNTITAINIFTKVAFTNITSTDIFSTNVFVNNVLSGTNLLSTTITSTAVTVTGTSFINSTPLYSMSPLFFNEEGTVVSMGATGIWSSTIVFNAVFSRLGTIVTVRLPRTVAMASSTGVLSGIVILTVPDRFTNTGTGNGMGFPVINNGSPDYGSFFAGGTQLSITRDLQPFAHSADGGFPDTTVSWSTTII